MDKNIIAFVREDTKTVNVKFFPDSARKVQIENRELAAFRSYKYITTLDLAPGDLVMVVVGFKPEIVEVQSVDAALNIEPDEDIQYKWVMAKIDTSYAKEIEEQNNKLQEIITKSYVDNARQTFRTMFLAALDTKAVAAIGRIIKPKVKKG